MDWNSFSVAIFFGFLRGLLEGALIAWPIWLMLGIITAVKAAFRIREKRRLATSGIAEIDTMDGRTFEKYLEVLFEKLGYRVELTRYVGDYGADLVARKDGVKTVIQAKRFRKAVGVKGIQEAVAAKGMYGCQAAMVVTNSTYTRQAVTLARANDVLLWDRDQLVDALLRVKGELETPANPAPASAPRQSPPPTMAAPAPVTVPEPATPATPGEPATVAAVCATCGKPVSEKVRAYCVSRADRFGGRLYCYDHQRSAPRL